MAIYILDISGNDLDTVRYLIRNRRFESVEEFLRTSVRNQLVLERLRDPGAEKAHEAIGRAETGPPSGVDPHAPQRLDLMKLPFYQLISRQTTVDLQGKADVLLEARPDAHAPLFGQFYRVLPLKVVLRAVAASCTSGLPELAAISPRVKQIAVDVGAALRTAVRDQRSESAFSLATGFPSDERDPAKSASRFESQYLGRIRKSGEADGFGYSLGFLGWRIDSDRVFVGLTEPGLQFAMLENPVLDSGVADALSRDEVAFLVSWIRKGLPAEHEHLESILSFVRSGANNPPALAQLMMKFYLDRFKYENWTISKANLMRSGGVSRLVEMRLLTAEKEGPRVVYSVNDEMATSVGFQLNPKDRSEGEDRT